MSNISQAQDMASEVMARIRQKQGIAAPTPKAAPKPLVRKFTPPVKLKAANPPKKSKPKAPKVGPQCACGCKGHTRGGTYLPGHDSKHRSMLAGPKVMPDCLCGCGGKTKGGRYQPGHDAKHHSALRAAEKAQAEAKAKLKKAAKAEPRTRISHKGAAIAPAKAA